MLASTSRISICEAWHLSYLQHSRKRYVDLNHLLQKRPSKIYCYNYYTLRHLFSHPSLFPFTLTRLDVKCFWEIILHLLRCPIVVHFPFEWVRAELLLQTIFTHHILHIPSHSQMIYWQYVQSQKEHIGLERAGIPTEVARVVGFLASGFSSYMTGANMVVDGGASTMCPLTVPL